MQVSFSGGERGFEMSMDGLGMSVAESWLGGGEKCLGVFSFKIRGLPWMVDARNCSGNLTNR